jgi:hypothetical protein
MELFLVEAPIGDGFLNADLWAQADEQVVPQEQRGVLEVNGFRVGQMGGLVPAGLQKLLGSERSCPNPRRLFVHAGTPTSVQLGGSPQLGRFQLHRDADVEAVSFEKVQCTLVIVPSLTPEGRTRLQFIPEIRHGESKPMPGPTEDLSGWVVRDQQPKERYAFLAWDVTLAANEYVLVGGRFDHPDTLGRLCFVRGDEPAPRQQLLVIRAGHSAAEGAATDATPDDTDEPVLDHGPPLALQAAWSTVRGCTP